MRGRSRIACISAAAFAAIHSLSLLQAANLTWDADPFTPGVQDAAGNWDTTTPNWLNGGTNIAWSNANPDSALFGTAAGVFNNATPAHNVTVTSAVTAQNINLGIGSTGGIYNIFDDFGGGALTLAGNVEKSASNGTSQFLLGNGLTLTSGQHTFAIRDTPGTAPELTMNAEIKGTGGVTVDNGAYEQWGTLLFTTDNSYTGATNINKGRLVIASGGALGSGSAAVTIDNQGALSIGGADGVGVSGTVTVSKPLVIKRSVYTGLDFDHYADAFIAANVGNQYNVDITGPVTIDSTDARFSSNTSKITITSNMQQGPNVTAGVFTADGDFAGTISLQGNNTALLGGIKLMGGVEVDVTNQNNLGGPSSPLTFVGSATLHPIGGFMTDFGTHVVNFGSFSGGIDVDPGQSFTINQNLTGGSLGKRGTGTMNIGGTNNLTGGQTYWDAGTVNLTGAGTSTYHSIHLRSSVVNLGVGTIVTTNNFSSFGESSNGTNGGPDKATVNVFGTGALVLGDADFNLSDGANTAGTLNISGNGYFSVAGITAVAKSAGATGTINQSGGSFIVTRTGNFGLVLGDRDGTGTYNISGGILTSAGEMYVGQGGSGKGYLNQSGGTITVNNWFVVGREGGAGTVDLSGGTFIKASGGNTEIDVDAGVGSSVMTIRNSAKYQAQTGDFRVGVGNGSSGTLIVKDSASVVVSGGEFWVGQGGGSTGTAIFQDNGSISVNNNWIAIGRAGGSGTLSLSGNASLTKNGGGNSIIADGSTGNATVAGSASMTINSGEFWVGQGGGSNATLNIQDSGKISVLTNWMAVGRNGGSGTVNMTGGTLVKAGGGNLTVGSGGGSRGTVTQTAGVITSNSTMIGEGGAGTVSLSGGVANLGDLYVGKQGGDSGLLNISGTASVNAATLTVHQQDTVVSVLNLSGGSLTAGSTLNNGTILASGTGTASLSAVTGNGSILLSSSAAVRAASVQQTSVQLAGTSTLTILQNGSSTGTSRIASLSVASPARLDLNDNDLIVVNGTYATITGLIRTARNGGAWNQPGITSSTAGTAVPKNKTLGTITGAEFHAAQGAAATFDGFTVADTDLLVKFTYYGDSDLNGQVNFDDYSRIDAGFNNARTGWFNGDFDYSGAVDFDDYSLIDNAFNTQSGTLRRAMSYLDGGDRSDQGMNTPALQLVMDHFAQFGQPYATGFLNAVPEPTSAMVFAGVVASVATMRRRRRK